ncbi:hypothetical protein UNH65_29795 [Chitinophaga sp. 180180018-2]|nr:hypothetical protein [Chitinophaga sp. 212800010-3]
MAGVDSIGRKDTDKINVMTNYLFQGLKIWRFYNICEDGFYNHFLSERSFFRNLLATKTIAYVRRWIYI